MTERALRAQIRELMASGVPPPEPPVIQRSGAEAVKGRHAVRQEVCMICADPGPTVSYFWTGGQIARLHAACDALWQQERARYRRGPGR